MLGKISKFSLYFFLLCVLFCSCTVHEHEWQDATCTTAKTCSICDHTDGDPLGHVWTDSTCTVPKTCSICGETNGNPSKHDWVKATCEVPKTCSVCGVQDGDPLGHSFNPATWSTTVRPTCQSGGERSNTCLRVSCGATVTRPVSAIDCIPGNWQTVEDASTSTLLIKARYCSMCGKELDRKDVHLSDSGGNDTSGTGGNNFNTYNNESQQQTTASYVLNTSTKKFHRPSCRDVPKISAKNYATSSKSRSDLISSGYSACGHCKP